MLKVQRKSKTKRTKPNVLDLTLLYNENESCHSRESGNPVEKTGFRIKSGMTFMC